MESLFPKGERVALGFSGGVDSAYLLYRGVEEKADFRAYYVKTPFQPEFEWNDAKRLAKELNVPLTTIFLDILSDPLVTENKSDRCYYCKKQIFGAIERKAKEDGCTLLADGTNASDDPTDRPGMVALKELSVISPLRDAGLTKDEIRRLSREAGLFTFDKPAYACLATRIPTGETITKELLYKTEKGEDFLFSLGFSDFRIRYFRGAAKLQFPKRDLPAVLNRWEEIKNGLKADYDEVLLDPSGR